MAKIPHINKLISILKYDLSKEPFCLPEKQQKEILQFIENQAKELETKNKNINKVLKLISEKEFDKRYKEGTQYSMGELVSEIHHILTKN
mgnify:CR=1 FL=1